MGSYPDTDIDPQIYYGALLQRKQSKAKQNPRLKYFIYDLRLGKRTACKFTSPFASLLGKKFVRALVSLRC